jgi:phosphoserine phosphatase
MVLQRKLVALDMDGTILDGRVIQRISEKFGLEDAISNLRVLGLSGYVLSQEIAKLLKQIPESALVDAAESLNFVPNLQQSVAKLKTQGHVIGIISDSYHLAVRHVANKLGLNFAIANHIETKDKILTGNIDMPLGWEKTGCYCNASVCKRYHLEEAAKKFNIPIENTVAVGDTMSDSCMIERAHIGIAFTPKDRMVEQKADVVIKTPDFSAILSYI